MHHAHEGVDRAIGAGCLADNPGIPEPVHAVHVGGGPVPHRVRTLVDHVAQQLAGVPSLQE